MYMIREKKNVLKQRNKRGTLVFNMDCIMSALSFIQRRFINVQLASIDLFGSICQCCFILNMPVS